MSTTISDLEQNSEAFTNQAAERFLQKSELVRGGIVAVDPQFSAAANEAQVVKVRSWKAVERPTTDKPFAATDALGTTANAFNLEQQAEMNHTMHRQGAWGASDFADEVSNTDTLGYAASVVSDYWRDFLQVVVISQLKGVLANNDSADSDDMFHDISGAANTTASSTTRFSKSAFTTALQSRGDRGEEFGAIFMHSAVFYPALDADIISTQIPSDYNGALARGFYLGRPVFVDDSMPAGTNAITSSTGSAEAGVYTTFILDRNAFALGIGTRKTPTEIDRAAFGCQLCGW